MQRRRLTAQTGIPGDGAAQLHVRELRQLMSGSGVPAFMHDRNQLKSLPQDIRRSLQETASALMIQVPNIVGLYENLLRNLEEITLELEESSNNPAC